MLEGQRENVKGIKKLKTQERSNYKCMSKILKKQTGVNTETNISQNPIRVPKTIKFKINRKT